MFYIDIFLKQNILMNLLVLSLTCMLDQRMVCHRTIRILAAAIAGAVLEAVMLLVLPYGFAVAAVALIVVPAMLFVAFGKENKKQGLFRLACSWLSIVLLNGVATAVYNLTGISQLHLFLALVVFVITVFLVQSTKTRMRQQQRMFPVVLINGTKKVHAMGLYDSGNLLTMPQHNDPVHIADAALLQKLVDEHTIQEKIAYRALGNADGRLLVYQMTQMKILKKGGRQEKQIQPVWLGCADHGLMEGKPYQIILHASVREKM